MRLKRALTKEKLPYNYELFWMPANRLTLFFFFVFFVLLVTVTIFSHCRTENKMAERIRFWSLSCRIEMDNIHFHNMLLHSIDVSVTCSTLCRNDKEQQQQKKKAE